MIGPGKYDDLCTEAREKAQANGALLIIVEGAKGNGFSAQLTPEVLLMLPTILREVADQIAESLPGGRTRH